MEVPTNLPTDHLYKFMALSGLVLVMFVIYHYSAESDKLHEKCYRIKSEMAIVKAKIKADSIQKRTDKSSDLLIEIKLKLIQKQLDSKMGESAFASTTKLVSDQEIELSELKKRILDDIINMEKMDSQIKISQSLNDRLDRNVKYLFILFIIGVFISIQGFRLWYKRIQKYLDESLRIDSLKK